MSAVVLPFPLSRRLDLIQRQAEYALALKPDKGEAHIERQIRYQADALRRRGIPEELVRRELASMRAAIGVAMWRLTFGETA
ncbi:DUF6074 family protein [Bradyrhizobium sp. WYCCWR 13022]|uniref:DUF6074 family protein n=1 Tax=unclassified Bradyrhizobium TaxID=2631580 RepID=UPI00263BC8B7|nr:DUF6074 family protein [Bradyrhizobium sp. WYCCWR 13022]MDN4982311.1 DUF6074 family protein [Bradyrhizobium sp. WYCCWR 13022]